MQRSRLPRILLPLLPVLAVALLAAGCGRDMHAETHASAHPPDEDTVTNALHVNCAHASCGNHFFVDAVPSATCSVGAGCAVAVTLVATGDYHINDEYPYKFRADEGPGLEFLGKGEGERNIFSKVANDWTKTDERTGTMAVTFRPVTAGSKVIAGVFKLSVCSAQSCQLEQQRVKATVTIP